MRRIIFSVLCASTVAFASPPSHAQLFEKKEPRVEVPAPRGAPQSFADLAEKLSPSVVNISSTQKIDAEEQEVLDSVLTAPAWKYPLTDCSSGEILPFTPR